ncbi:hypothetical protein [Phenylobacterium sp.]|uniref:hypothetical protein n=1 Tax=Phenylobacterium sp. TaxID=1871053 RepID=UPI002C5BE883|nr:hypothetical protein [Phenylobacterium sp.]HVI31021.1 hypothetical protein [Phenylobacterium sp.]
MTNSEPTGGGDRPGLNPDLKRSVDSGYSDEMHGSEPLAKVSVKEGAPAVWPTLWAVVTIALILLTIWFVL